MESSFTPEKSPATPETVVERIASLTKLRELTKYNLEVSNKRPASMSNMLHMKSYRNLLKNINKQLKEAHEEARNNKSSSTEKHVPVQPTEDVRGTERTERDSTEESK